MPGRKFAQPLFERVFGDRSPRAAGHDRRNPVRLPAQPDGRQRAAAADERRHMRVDLRQQIQVEPRLRLLAQVGAPGRLEQRASHEARLIELAAGGAFDRGEHHRVDAPRGREHGGSRSVRRRSERPGRRYRRHRVAARGIGEVVRRRSRRNERGAIAEPVRLDQRRHQRGAIRILDRNADGHDVLDEIRLRRQIDGDGHADVDRSVEVDHPAHALRRERGSHLARPSTAPAQRLAERSRTKCRPGGWRESRVPG